MTNVHMAMVELSTLSAFTALVALHESFAHIDERLKRAQRGMYDVTGICHMIHVEKI